MSDPITNIQERYLLELLERVGQDKYEELKKQLRISKETSVAELTKDEAYKLISKMITEASPKDVEKALALALEKEDN